MKNGAIDFARDFVPGSPLHFASLLGCSLSVAAFLFLRRAVRGNEAGLRGLRLFAGWGSLVAWVANTTFWNIPPRFDWSETLPLEFCNLANLIGAVALLGNRRFGKTILYFWALTLCIWAFLTPVLKGGYATVEFWMFWIYHLFILLGLAEVLAEGYRPRWTDFRNAWVFTGVCIVVLAILDYNTGWNYGFVGPSVPNAPTIIDLLGDYPLRLIWMILIGTALYLLVWQLPAAFGFRGMKKFLIAIFFSIIAPAAAEQRYPAHANVIDVTKPPWSAKGDGVTDDTESLQAALNEHVGRHHVLWFPRGTYLISKSLTWPKEWAGHQKWGFTMLRGEERDSTIIRLKDGTFTDAGKPQAMMRCGGFGSADWFHNYVENLTFHVGEVNPGATAIQFYSNNTGALRDCRFVAPVGSGAVGIDLSHRDMNGPLLVRNCEVNGFQRGVTTARAVNSQVFESLVLRGQQQIGFTNEGQPISIRSLVSENRVPVLGTYGTLLLMEATLTGLPGAENSPALINYNHGRVFFRDVRTTGYRRALADMQTPDFAAAWRVMGGDKPGSVGPDLTEYVSTAVTSAFPSPSTSLRLPVRETPSAVWEEPAKWAVVDDFGADPAGKTDSTEAIQRAFASGAATIFLPGSYQCRETIVVQGSIRTIIGLGGSLNYGRRDLINFRIEDGTAPVVEIKHFGHLGGGIEIATRRAVVLRSLETHTLLGTSASEGGEVYIEDVVGGNFRFRKQKVWARQLNIENEGTHLTNDAGDVWILGYKTERGGTLAHTLNGGRTEILGGFSYTTTAGKLAPMFVNEGSSMWTYFAERCYNGDPFASLVRETRSGETREVKPNPATTEPYSGRSK